MAVAREWQQEACLYHNYRVGLAGGLRWQVWTLIHLTSSWDVFQLLDAIQLVGKCCVTDLAKHSTARDVGRPIESQLLLALPVQESRLPLGCNYSIFCSAATNVLMNNLPALLLLLRMWPPSSSLAPRSGFLVFWYN